MKNLKLDERVLYRLFEITQDFLNSNDDSGRERADKAAHQYVDTIYFEDIYVRAVYLQFYEDEKIRGRTGLVGKERRRGKLIDDT